MASQQRLKNPHGGLTKAGRDWFAREQGSHLKPGVKKSRREMTPADLHRKGSWAVRFYGRKGRLPPLRKPDGEPTRYALTAAAWGEPVPTSVAAARRIAAKGHALLAAYAKSKARAPAKQTAAGRSKTAVRSRAPTGESAAGRKRAKKRPAANR